MKNFVLGNISNPDTVVENTMWHHKITMDGTLRTYPLPVKDKVWIYINGDKLTPKQCFALFCLIMSPGYANSRELSEPIIEGDIATWDDIVTGAKK